MLSVLSAFKLFIEYSNFGFSEPTHTNVTLLGIYLDYINFRIISATVLLVICSPPVWLSPCINSYPVTLKSVEYPNKFGGRIII